MCADGCVIQAAMLGGPTNFEKTLTILDQERFPSTGAQAEVAKDMQVDLIVGPAPDKKQTRRLPG